MQTKQELRKTILQKRNMLSLMERQTKSQTIAKKIIESIEYQEAEKLLLFVSHGSEVDTEEIMAHALECGKSVYVPKVQGNKMEFYQINGREDLCEGYRGILEPRVCKNLFVLEERDLKICILMPGAVFDAKGGRIGYGGGFYDKFLQELELEIKQKKKGIKILSKIAIAYECQIVECGQIPKEEHDIAPDCIMTEKERYCWRNKYFC